MNKKKEQNYGITRIEYGAVFSQRSIVFDLMFLKLKLFKNIINVCSPLWLRFVQKQLLAYVCAFSVPPILRFAKGSCLIPTHG